MKQYSVKQLAQLAGISVRSLHLYDRMGLLKPALRTEARYRRYGETELLRLQQILFYKELDFPLQAIAQILDDPHFDLVKALEAHKQALLLRQERIQTLMATIDNTIHHLNAPTMLSHEALYEGLPKEKAQAYRQEAVQEYGEHAVIHAENQLVKMGKAHFNQLKAEQVEIGQKLHALRHENPGSALVQQQVARHYHNIRSFWGTSQSADLQVEAYMGLADLYVSDERFTTTDGQSDPAYAAFLQKAMHYFAKTLITT